MIVEQPAAADACVNSGILDHQKFQIRLIMVQTASLQSVDALERAQTLDTSCFLQQCSPGHVERRLRHRADVPMQRELDASASFQSSRAVAATYQK